MGICQKATLMSNSVFLLSSDKFAVCINNN